jgi:hypothetical protein
MFHSTHDSGVAYGERSQIDDSRRTARIQTCVCSVAISKQTSRVDGYPNDPELRRRRPEITAAPLRPGSSDPRTHRQLTSGCNISCLPAYIVAYLVRKYQKQHSRVIQWDIRSDITVQPALMVACLLWMGGRRVHSAYNNVYTYVIYVMLAICSRQF